MAAIHGKHPAVFLDRDGTLIREKNYLRKIKDVRLLKGAADALRSLRAAGFKLILITNQSGIARGYLTEEKLRRIHAHLQTLLRRRGAELDAIYYCPHHPDEKCACRKPSLLFPRKARKRFALDLAASYSVGDHGGDYLLGQKMGGKGIFVLTGHGRKERAKMRSYPPVSKPDKITANLASAARWILRERSRRGHGTSLKQ